MAEVLDDISLMDECYMICLNYIKCVSIGSVEHDAEALNITDLNKLIEDHAPRSFMKHYAEATAVFVHLSSVMAEWKVAAVTELAAELKETSLDQKTYEEACYKLLDKQPVVTTWEQIAMLLQLMHQVFQSYNDVEVVGLAVQTMLKIATEFIEEKGGWLQVCKVMNDPELYSSLVVISQDHDESTTEKEHLSSPPLPASPPGHSFQIIPAECDEQDSFDSATPPELVEKPPMTASLMQLMSAAGDHPKSGNGDSSNGFEVITPPQQPGDQHLPSLVDARLLGQGDAQCGDQSETSAVDQSALPITPVDQSSSPTNPTDQSIDQSNASTKQESDVDDGVLNARSYSARGLPADRAGGAGVSDYIPHISLGVAAAAACIGLILLRKT